MKFNQADRFRTSRLSNGLTVIGEHMPWANSTALSIIVPVGTVNDPPGLEGQSSLLSEMFSKGAGAYNSEELSEQFENLGIERSCSAGSEVTVFSGSFLEENISQALRLFSLMILEPRLPAEDLEGVKQLALQDLLALEDSPSSKAMLELTSLYYRRPFGNSQVGTVEGIESVTVGTLASFIKENVCPGKSIVAVCGKFDWNSVLAEVAKYFGSWSGDKALLIPPHPPKSRRSLYINHDSNQVHLALAYPSVTCDHPDFYVASVSNGILSGGMFGRLFIEVREKRGLVYTVSASLTAARKRSAVFVHAGTTPDKAEMTLDVILAELEAMQLGVTADEIARSKADLKSRLIMRAEIPGVRVQGLASDWWSLGRLRSLEEVRDNIDKVQSEEILRHVCEVPFKPLALVALGKQGNNLFLS